MARKKSDTAKTVLLLAELTGLGLSIYLILVGIGLFTAPCPRGSSIFACHSVLTGAYSKIGPIPVAAMGMAYFVAQLTLTLLLRRKGVVPVLKLAAVLSGLAFVAYLRAVEILWIKAICVWCWGVALTVLAEAFFTISVATPPLPKLSALDRFAALVIVFLTLIGASLGVGYLVGPQEPVRRGPKPGPAVASRTPQPDRTGQAPKPPVNSAAKPKTGSEHETPKPAATKAAAGDDVPEGEMTAEQLTLAQNGWRIVSSAAPIERAVKSSPPVLMLAFKSECVECQGFIYGTLSTPVLDGLGLTRFAIEEKSLKGTISDMVVNVPTLLLFDRNGKMVYKHESRIAGDALKAQIQKALGRP